MEAPGKSVMPDFTFGFNDVSFSDKTLRLEIVDEVESDTMEPNTKRRRFVDLTKEPRVKNIHINTLILASRSSFFHKLFTNGMLESLQKEITLRIDVSEEASFTDLMKYLYSNNLPTSLNALLDLCVIADKFEVVSCLRDCVRSLETLPMTSESASLYLDLPQSLLMLPTIRQLVDAAKKFHYAKFNNFHEFKEEMLSMPLDGIRAVLASDDLQVTSEYVVYNFVLEWARKHYPDMEERRGILKTHLLDLVRFPFLSTTNLVEEVQTCSDIGPEVASKIVIHALRFKAETPYQKHCLAAKENTASRQFVKRAYTFQPKFQPVKVVELDELPLQPCVVYLHFPKEKIKQMVFPGGQIMSETFYLGGQELVLLGETALGAHNFGAINFRHFWLVLKVLGSATVEINYEIQLRTVTKHGAFAATKHDDFPPEYHFQSGMTRPMRRQPKYQFESWVNGSHKFTESDRTLRLKSLNWNTMISDHGSNIRKIFIDNILSVRAELSIKK